MFHDVLRLNDYTDKAKIKIICKYEVAIKIKITFSYDMVGFVIRYSDFCIND